MVECSPATRAIRIRFPVDAFLNHSRTFCIVHNRKICNKIYCEVSPIHFERGSKQCCSLAILLYVIYIEKLLLKFKKELWGA